MATITALANPVYASADKSMIDGTATVVDRKGKTSTVPFTATSYDGDVQGKQVYADLIAGKYGPIAAYVAPAPKPAPVKSASVKGPNVVA